MLPATNPLPVLEVMKSLFINNIIKLMVEAGGIEPPSEGLWHKAATCLICVLVLGHVLPTGRLSVSQPL